MKTIKLICIVLAMLFMLVGCAQSEETTTQEETSTTTTEVTTETTTETTTEEPTTEAVIEPTEVSVGETFVIDDVAEMTLTEISYSNYIYYDYNTRAEINSLETNTGLILVFSYQNLYTSSFGRDNENLDRTIIFNDLIFNNKYTYEFLGCLNNEIQPLATDNLNFFYTIPLEVMNSDEPLLVYFSVGDESYVFDVRSAE